jgi:hypothetical protein
MFLDFVNATALDSRITFTRTTTATVTNSSGAIQSSAINSPRFDYDPVTLQSKGLLIEEQRINLLLNSLINGTSLSTQSVTVTAVPHTISFYGTGSITLTGAATATVTGTGVYPNRQTLTFTPIVGVLVCTVLGSVQYAQLEAGGFVTSFIPTAGTAVTRAADVATMTGTNFSSWYNQSEGTFIGSFTALQTVFVASSVFASTTGSANDEVYGYYSPTLATVRVAAGGVQQALMTTASVSAGNTYKLAAAYKVNNFATSLSGGTVTTDTSGTVPTTSQLSIGARSAAAGYINGYIRQITYYNTRLANATLQVLTR